MTPLEQRRFELVSIPSWVFSLSRRDPEDIQEDIQSAAEEMADDIDESVIDSLPEDSNMRDNIQSIQNGEFEW